LNVRENFYDADAPRLYTPQSVENTGSHHHDGMTFAVLPHPLASGGQPAAPPPSLLLSPPPLAVFSS
uniref:Estrogen receptor alpha n=1 Tax=Haemonchus placei TaxID=6290 RepID=A0A0N4VYU7_HAEPC